MYIEFDIDENLNVCDFYLSKLGKSQNITRLKDDMDKLNCCKVKDIEKNGRKYDLYRLPYKTNEDKKQVEGLFLDKKSIIYKCNSLDEEKYLKFKNEIIKVYPMNLNKEFTKDYKCNLDNLKLLPHQQHIYNLVNETNKKGFALFMEMGTGKTFVSIAIMIKHFLDLICQNNFNGIFKVLVVAPKDALTSWNIELEKHFKRENKLFASICDCSVNINVVKVEGNVSKRRELLTTGKQGINLYLVSCDSIYNTIISNEQIIKSFDMCIADESQFMKTYNSKRAVAMHEIGEILSDKPKLILSGTPISNNPLELWSQFSFLEPNRVGSYESFKYDYTYTIYGSTIYTGLYNFVNGLSDITYYIDKETVMSKMETPEENIMNIDFSNDLEEYNKIKVSNNSFYLKDKDEALIKIKLKDELINDTKKKDLIKKCETNNSDKENIVKINVRNILSQYIKFQQFTGGFLRSEGEKEYKQVSNLKLNKLETLIDDILTEGNDEKIVIFAQFKHELNHIFEMLKKKNVPCIEFKSEDDMQTRENKVNEFQTNNNYKVFLSQLKCGCKGITLTAARNMIYYSINYSYSDYAQSRARIFRIGQSKKCRYYNLICENTIDEHIINAVKYKEDMAKVLSEKWKVITEKN